MHHVVSNGHGKADENVHTKSKWGERRKVGLDLTELYLELRLPGAT